MYTGTNANNNMLSDHRDRGRKLEYGRALKIIVYCVYGCKGGK